MYDTKGLFETENITDALEELSDSKTWIVTIHDVQNKCTWFRSNSKRIYSQLEAGALGYEEGVDNSKKTHQITMRKSFLKILG